MVMPERIYARKSQYWSRHLEDTDVTEYVRADLHRKALDRIALLEKALEQAVDFAAMEVLDESEVELDNGELSILPEGLACSHQRLRGTDEYKDLVSHLKEKEC